MTDDPLDAMKARWNHIQGYLFPWLREEVDPMTEALGRLVTTLDVIGLEAFVPEPPRGAGRPPDDRRALARAFVAKAVLGVPTTTALIERLDVDKSLRRILGWERRSQVPSEATFSRAFAEFAQGDLPDKMHAALIERSLGGRISVRNLFDQLASLCLPPRSGSRLKAKLFSSLSPGVQNATYFDQAARSVACIAEVLSRASGPKWMQSNSKKVNDDRNCGKSTVFVGRTLSISFARKRLLLVRSFHIFIPSALGSATCRSLI